MPLISVTYSSSRQTPSLKADIAADVAELTAKILHKDPKVTAIIVKSVDAADPCTTRATSTSTKSEAMPTALTQERRYIAARLDVTPQNLAA